MKSTLYLSSKVLAADNVVYKVIYGDIEANINIGKRI